MFVFSSILIIFSGMEKIFFERGDVMLLHYNLFIDISDSLYQMVICDVSILSRDNIQKRV